MRNVGSGTITVTGIPANSRIKFAYLYWHGPTNSADPNVNANVFVNDVPIAGTNIGFSGDNNWGYQNSQAYRADITSLVTGNGSYQLTGFGASTTAGANTNGASLIIFYDDGNPANYRDVVLLNGNDSNGNLTGSDCHLPTTGQTTFDAAGWNATASGIQYSGGAANLQLHVADGQSFSDDALKINGFTLPGYDVGPIFQGDSVPGVLVSGVNGTGVTGNLWDIKNFDITNFLTTEGQNTLTVTTGVYQDCLSLVAAAFDVPSSNSTAPSQTAQPQPITAGGTNVLQFNTNPNQKVEHDLTWPQNLTYQIGVDKPQLVSTNTVVSNHGGIQPFLANTPWAVGLLMEHQGDNQVANGTGFGSMYADKCYQKGADPSTATLSNCPVGTTASDLVHFADIFDSPGNGKVDIAPGTTVSLVHHPGTRVADGITPTIDWLPVPSGSPTNQVCTQVQIQVPINGFSCDLEDGLTYDPATMPPILPVSQGGAPGGVSGDPTVGGGLKGRGVLASVYNVPMLTTQVSVNGQPVNNPGMQGSGIHWFNSGNLNFDFLVSPANASPPGNGWFAAPVNNLAYVFYNSNSTEPPLPNPPNCGTSATGSCALKAGSAVPGTFGVAGTAPKVEFVDGVSSQSNGVYTLAWSARDTVQIGERNIQLLHSSGATCPNPFGLSPAPTPPCYSTTLFSEQIGIDTVPPTATITSPANTTYFLNQPVPALYSCNDPTPGSGLASCVSVPNVAVNSNIDTSSIGPKSFKVTATDVANNTASTTVNYTVVDRPADLDLLVVAPPAVKNGTTLWYGIIAVNFGPYVASNVKVTAPLPTGTTLVKAVFVKCTVANPCFSFPVNGNACSQVGNNVVCNIGSLDLLKNLTGVAISIVVNVPGALKGQTLTETATIVSSNRDPRTPDNTSTAHTVVK
jgi:uncharacterized repeat protein (TIGR01451 family)